MAEQKKAYVPPYRRNQEHQPSKFESFLSNHADRRDFFQRSPDFIQAESDWGSRDHRSGYVDKETYDEAEKLFGEHSVDSGISFETYEDIPVEVSEEMPVMESFTDCEVHPTIMANVARLQYTKPTPVQKHAIPIYLMRRDLMACAQTGSGKTASYLFPMIAKMLNDGPPPAQRSKAAMPVGLCLSPTRELAVQIYQETMKFAARTGLRTVVIYGGADPKIQSRQLERGVDIIVATPGRLLDFMSKCRISLQFVKYLVIDEADRMLDMGFEPQIRRILETEDMPEQRETIMCSATFPQEIQSLATQFLTNYIFLTIGRVGSTTDSIKQELRFVDEYDKRGELHDILQEISGLVLIFVETKKTADFLEDFLYRGGYAATSIHGDKSQFERERALQMFKSGERPILVATDVAARGLDIKNVGNVINFDCPSNIDDYVHRIGRTGRAGSTGLAISFLNDKNKPIVKNLYGLLTETGQEIPNWFQDMYKEMVFSSSFSGRRSRGRYRRGGYRGDRYRY